MENLREELGALPQAHDVREALENPLNAVAYTNGVNGASVVFHNGRKGGPSEQDILMTGDATPETMVEIMDQLHDGYYILKAPHHGTASGYSNLFSDMSAAHILISNGEYHAGGAIAQESIDREDSVLLLAEARPQLLGKLDGMAQALPVAGDVGSGQVRGAVAAVKQFLDGGIHGNHSLLY